jgi:hypothetical protein
MAKAQSSTLATALASAREALSDPRTDDELRNLYTELMASAGYGGELEGLRAVAACRAARMSNAETVALADQRQLAAVRKGEVRGRRS